MIGTDPLARTAERLGMSTGGLYTVAIGLVVATALTLTGPPAAFSERAAASSEGLGVLAPPAPVDTAIATPATPPTTGVPPAAVGDAPRPTAPVAPVAPSRRPAVAPASRRTLGDSLTTTDVPGRVHGIVAIDGGALVAVDRDDADPLVARVSDSGEIVSSVVITGRLLDGEIDISGLDVTPDGQVLVLVHGPAALLELDPASGELSTRAEIPDVPPCPVALPVPVPCEPGLVDHEPSPVDVAMVGDSVLVSDPAQGALWRIAPDGAIELAASSSAYQASETSPGLRGLATRSDRAALATINDTLAEIVVGTGDVTTATVGELGGPGIGVAIAGDGSSYALIDGGRVEVRDAELDPTADLSAADATAIGVGDSLWVVVIEETSSTLVQRTISPAEER